MLHKKSVLDAFEKVDRSLFVLPEYRSVADADEALPISCGQTISQPSLVAKMTELLNLAENSKVLEIGTGSGYQTAILAELAGEVFTIELIPELHETAKKRLDSLGYTNVHAAVGDGYSGWPDEAPFDAIIVTAAPPVIPEALTTQLSNGGRMVIPVGDSEQMLCLITKSSDGLIQVENIFPVIFVPMRHQKTTHDQ